MAEPSLELESDDLPNPSRIRDAQMTSTRSQQPRFSTQTKIGLLITSIVLVALAALACFVKSLVFGTPSQTAFFEFVALALILLSFFAIVVGILYLNAVKAASVWKPDLPTAQMKANSNRPRPRFTFGIWSMLLITFASAVTAAVGSYYVKALRADTSPKAVFIIFAIAAPMLMVVFVSVSYQISRLLKERKKRRGKVYEYTPDDN